MHVALVRGLRVDDERADARAAGLGGDEGHRRWAEAHAVPLRRQMRVPEALALRLLAEADHRADVLAAVGAVGLEALLFGTDVGVHEFAHAETHFLDIGRESKINAHNGTSLPVFVCSRL